MNENVKDTTLSKSSKETDKIFRFLTFLKEVATLRSRPIKHVDKYEHILWLNSIPREKGCFCRLWDDLEENDGDIWLEIKKPKEPRLPSVPSLCEKWVDKDTLHKLNDYPLLFKEIVEERLSREDINLEPEIITLFLKDYPEVSRMFDEYIETKWDQWRDHYEQWRTIHDIYSTLFTIHQAQLKLGEDYELILGIGLLKWRSSKGEPLCRHIITAKIDLIFESQSAKFIIAPSPDNIGLKLERDIIETENLPIQNEKQIINTLKNSDSPWDMDSLIPALRSLANTISTDGEFIENDNSRIVKPSLTTTEKLIIEFAPAVILRKRPVDMFCEALSKIEEEVRFTGNVPQEFQSICEINIAENTSTETEEENKYKFEVKDSTIYFPKPFNREQEKIIEKLNYATGVLVKGPPGTGKSHTIANIICHLLANGQKILITAQTPRALKVLHELLPKQIRPLCVSLLGTGQDEKQSIEASVNGILRKQEIWDQEAKNIEIIEACKKTELLRSERARIRNRIIDIADKDINYKHVVGTYKGTAIKIVSILNEQKSIFEWFKDRIPYKISFPLSKDEHNFLKARLNLLSDKDTQNGKLPIIGNDLPDSHEFRIILDKYIDLKCKKTDNKQFLITLEAEHLRKLSQESFDDCFDRISKLYTKLKETESSPDEWIKKAVFDLLSGNQIMWGTYYKELDVFFQAVDTNYSVCGDCDVQVSNNISVDNKLLKNAQNLKDYLQNGGKIGKFFNAKIVRENKHLITDIIIDSENCNTVSQLEKLIAHIEMVLNLSKAWALLESNIPKIDGPIVLQKNKLKQILDILRKIYNLFEEVKQTKDLIRTQLKINNVSWYTCDDIYRLLSIAESVKIEKSYNIILSDIKSQLKKIKDFSTKEGAHPVFRKAHNLLLNIVKQKSDFSEYIMLVRKVENEKKKNKNLMRLLSILDQLQKHAPIFVQSLMSTYQDSVWNERISQLEEAWAFQQARSWIYDCLNEENLKHLEQKLKETETDIQENTEHLASLKAWSICFKGMSDKHREHFIAWQDEFRKIRKTGKYRTIQRRNAQKHLNECKDAIPCWIMPLYRIYDTISVKKGAFDVVIIDEASQCGLESLPLFYMGKKVIIVGDDKQIAPENPGIDKGKIHMLQQKFLFDFEHHGSFDLETSLFAHARRRFGTNMIPLCEHFRCMPEIIRFCNDNFYADYPLIPLKQYPPKRLNPLVPVYVEDGEREGVSNKSINRNEAKKLIKQVCKCCEDPRYANKTIGIISLLGSKAGHIPYIEYELSKALGEEFEKRKIIVGDAYSFQGDERDIIFLTTVVAPNMRFTALTQPEDERRFNVAVSRAKEQLWLFHSVKQGQLNPSCLRRKLLDHFHDPSHNLERIKGVNIEELQKQVYYANRQLQKAPEPFDSWFEVDVALAIAQRGYKVIPQFQVAGKFIDLVIQEDKLQLAIECDGDYWHGRDKYAEDMDRQRILERCGWSFFRIREFAWRLDPELVMKELVLELERMDIYPITSQESNKKKQVFDELLSHELDLDLVDSSMTDFQEKGNIITEDNTQNKVEIQNELYEKHDIEDDNGILVAYHKYPIVIREGQIHEESTSNLANLIVSIIKTESPIHKEELITRIRECWGYGRAGRRIRESFDRAKRYMTNDSSIFERNNFFYCEGKHKLDDIRPRRRDNTDLNKNAFYISPEEYAIVSLEVLKKHGSLKDTDIEHRVSRFFGYKRTTPQIRTAISFGLELLVTDGYVILESNCYTLKDCVNNDVLPHKNGTDNIVDTIDCSEQCNIDYTGQKVKAFMFKDSRCMVSSWKEVLIKTCAIMNSLNSKDFEQILIIQGKSVPYFSKNPSDLRSPEKISNTDIYAETNFNANQVVNISTNVIRLFGYNNMDFKIHLE